MDTNDDKINKLADLLLQYKNTCVLTGAGISTESGIPDFRSAKTGMFNTLDQRLLCYSVMKDEPEVFWKNFEKFAQVGLQDIKPNKGHYALAELEKMGLIGHIVTQNVDGLHQAAGNTKVVEAHGHFKESYCMNSKCKKVFPYQLIADAMANGSYKPICPDCGYPLRPSVVLYGDQLPQVYHQFYNNDLYKYDFLLVLGTSLDVSTAQNVVYEFEGYGNYAIINKSATNKDLKAKVVIRAGIGDTLEQLLSVIKEKQNG
jgi:NAD-dependent deacetylase